MKNNENYACWHVPFSLDQRRMKLKSLESEEAPDAAMAKLTDQVKELKIQRLECAVEIKVRKWLF